MKAQELRTKEDGELKKLLLDLRKESLDLRVKTHLQKQTGESVKTSRFEMIRRDIARIKALLAARRLEKKA